MSDDISSPPGRAADDKTPGPTPVKLDISNPNLDLDDPEVWKAIHVQNHLWPHMEANAQNQKRTGKLTTPALKLVMPSGPDGKQAMETNVRGVLRDLAFGTDDEVIDLCTLPGEMGEGGSHLKALKKRKLETGLQVLVKCIAEKRQQVVDSPEYRQLLDSIQRVSPSLHTSPFSATFLILMLWQGDLVLDTMDKVKNQLSSLSTELMSAGHAVNGAVQKLKEEGDRLHASIKFSRCVTGYIC